MKRLLICATAALALLLVLALSAGTWLMFSTSGARWSLAQVPRLLPVTLHYQALQGSLWRGLDLEQLVVAGQAVDGFDRLELAGLQLRWQPLALWSGQLILDRLSLAGGRAYLPAARASAAPPALPKLDLPLSIRVAQLGSADLVIHRPDQTLAIPDFHTGLLLAGDQLRLSGLRFRYQQQDYQLNLKARLAEVLGVELTLPSHGVTGQGQCQADPALTCQGTLRWQDFAHPLLAPAQLPEGALDWQWRDQQLALTGSVQLVLPAAHIDSQVALTGTVDPARAVARVQSLQARYGGGSLAASGSLQWAQGFSADASLQAQGVDLSAWLPGLASRLDLDGGLQLALTGAGLTLALDAPAVSLDLGGTPLAGQLAFRLAPDGLQIPALSLSAAGSRLNLQGSWQFHRQLALEASLHSDDLSLLVPGLSGRARAGVRAAGPLGQLALSADLWGRQLGWQQTRIDALESQLKLRLAADAGSAQALLASLALDQLQLSARGLTQGDQSLGDLALQASGTSARHRLTLDSTGLPVRQLSAQGGLEWAADAGWRGSLTRLSLADGLTSAPWSLRKPAALSIAAHRLALADVCVGQQLAWVCIDQFALLNQQDFSLSAHLGGFYLDRERSLYQRWRETLPDHWQLRGELVGQLSGQGTLGAGGLARLDLDGALRARDAGLQYQLEQEADTLLDIGVQSLAFGLRGDQQVLGLAGELVLEGGEPLRLTGEARQWLTTGRELALSLQGQLAQLALLQPLLPEARELTGRAEADLAMTWNADGARFDGAIKLHDLGLQLPATGTRLSGWQVTLNARQRALQLAAQGRVGEGQATVSGRVEAQPDQRFDASLAINGQALKLVDLPDTQLVASPALNLRGDPALWQLSGELRLHDSRLRLRELPKSVSRVSEDARVYGLAQPPPPRQWLNLSTDVRLKLEDEVRFEGFGLTTHLQGDLHFRRTGSADNQVLGLVRLPSGRYRSYGQRLDIASGQLTFTGPLDNPGLDVRAARKVGDVTAGVWLSGTARHPKTQLYSVPTMSEADALAYIVTGKPLAASGEGDVVDMQAAALNLGLKQALPTLQAVGSQLGLTDIGLEDSEDGGSSLAAGKRIGDRLYLKYVYGLLGAAGNFVVQYQLTDRLDIQTSSGETQAIDLTYSWDSEPP